MVELVTMGQGEALYARWGHAALRISGNELDRVYNFGSIRLTPDFFAQMLQGKVYAFLEVDSFAKTAMPYIGEDRTITRHTLALTKDEKQRLQELLNHLKPRENYLYDHFADNCSTRILDILDEATQGRLKKAGSSSSHKTYRDLALEPIRRFPALYIGVDLALSNYVDQPITQAQASFSPEEFVRWLSHPEQTPLAISYAYDVHRSRSFREGTHYSWPWLLVFILGLPIYYLWLWFLPRSAIVFWGIVSGSVGLGLALLWGLSSFPFLAANPRVLLFLPSHLLLPILLFSSWRRFIPHYLGVHLLITGLMGCLVALGLQPDSLWAPLSLIFLVQAPGLLVLRKRASC